MRAVLTVLLGGVVLCLTVLFPLSAQGQGAHVAVLLVDSVELPVTAEEVGRDAWMEALPGAPSGGVLAERFRERASSEPASLSATDIDSLPERSQSAVRNLALGRYEAAAEDLRTTLELADRGLEELNRETQRAREVVDACLFMVRAYLESRRKDAAWDQALRCRRMFPDVKPTSEQLHTPEVRALVRKADAHLAEGPRGTLLVDSAPRGCAVRLNGRRMGKTPLRIDDLAIYTYRVQVECRDDGEFRGRVHEVSLAKQSKVYVDTRLDAAIRTMPILSLRYESEAEREAFQMRHGAAVAALLGVDAVWMLGWDAHGNVRALRIGSDRLSPAQVVLEKGDTPAPDPRIAEAAQLLAAGRSAWIDSEGQVRSMAPPPSPQPVRRTAPPQTPPDSSPVGWWGVALGVAGAVGMGIGWVLHALRSADGEDLAGRSPMDAGYLTIQGDWRGSRALPPVVLGLGSITATLGLLFALPGDADIPPWAWIAAAAGAGLAIWGGVSVVAGAPCEGDARGNLSASCIGDEERLERGLLLLGSSFPLLLTPLIHLLVADDETMPVPVMVTSLDRGLHFSFGSLW